jgi:hypothetical protein
LVGLINGIDNREHGRTHGTLRIGMNEMIGLTNYQDSSKRAANIRLGLLNEPINVNQFIHDHERTHRYIMNNKLSEDSYNEHVDVIQAGVTTYEYIEKCKGKWFQ